MGRRWIGGGVEGVGRGGVECVCVWGGGEEGPGCSVWGGHRGVQCVGRWCRGVHQCVGVRRWWRGREEVRGGEMKTHTMHPPAQCKMHTQTHPPTNTCIHTTHTNTRMHTHPQTHPPTNTRIHTHPQCTQMDPPTHPRCTHTMHTHVRPMVHTHAAHTHITRAYTYKPLT
jgi:hypothetical protein